MDSIFGGANRVIQGYFQAGRPRFPVQASLPGVCQARLRPENGGAQSPGKQGIGCGEAFRLPASLANFGGAVGQPLPDVLRRKMESFFGAGFADVRVHVGNQAASIGALAFTHGSNLYFAPGHYAPATAHGQQLLGHELAHVVQQRTGRVRNPFTSGLAVVHDRAMEAEADRLGRRAAAHQPVAQARLASAGPSRPALPAAVQTFRRAAGVVQRASDLREWEADVRAIARGHQQTGPNAGRPAEYDLIEKGPFRGPDYSPFDFPRRVRIDPVSAEIGLTRAEESSLYKYSQGMKDVRDSPGYMEPAEWQDLQSAVDKIPSMGSLGQVATVFRADRMPTFTNFLRKRIGKPCYIVHGSKLTAAGVHHLASAAFTVNSHAMKARSLVRIICASARYIQYWGMHGASLDGGEVLIPSGTISYYDGEMPHVEKFGLPESEEPRGGMQLRQQVPSGMKEIYTLVEVDISRVNRKLEFFDDFTGEEVDRGFLNRILPPLPPVPRPPAPFGKQKID